MNFKDLLPKNLPFNKEAPQDEYYFAITISPKEVIGALWSIEGKALKIINTSTVSYESQAQLSDACNQALDEALGDFQPEPTKILFGVPDSWLIDENLNDEYLSVLKKLVSDLDVEPMAYVSTTHAICHLLQKQTGVPATAILVDTAGPVDDVSGPLVVTVVKAGKIIGTKSAKRGEDLPQDIEKLLLSFTGIEVLPSKITLYGSDETYLEKYKDELTSFNWMGNLPFLHLPKVETLESGIEIKAVTLAGASEIDPDVIYSVLDLPSASRKPLQSSELKEVESHQEKRVLGNAGFVAGDIAQMRQEAADIPNEDMPPYGDIESERQDSAGGSPLESLMEKAAGVFAELHLTERLPFLKRKTSGYRNEPLEGSDNPQTAISQRQHPGGLPVSRRFDFTNRKYLLLGGLIILALAAAYIFLPRAKVTIFVDPHVLEKDAQVIADPSITSVDNVNSKIPGKIVETDVSGADKGTATGTKQIGQAAKGSVDIYNKTTSPQNFSQGTVLVGPNNLLFSLDSSVSIASASADVSGTTFGKVTVNVTAKQIGPDSNVPAGTNMSIQGQDSGSYNAVVNTALSGGTSQNVTVVTSDDQKRLLATVASELRSQAQTKLQSQLSGDEKILPEALNEQIQSTTYSKNIGDQASDFTLNLSVHYKGTAYSDTDLKTMVGKLVETNVPAGYQLNLADTQTQADVSKLNPDGSLVFLARFTANLIPKIDTGSIANDRKGKSPTDAAAVIQNVQDVIGSDFSITPTIPGPFERLPFISSHISFNVTTK